VNVNVFDVDVKAAADLFPDRLDPLLLDKTIN
jgi:hypothetical protein